MKDELEIQRLGWAGLQVDCGEHSLVIDLFENRTAMAPFIEEVGGELPPPTRPVDVALVTHLHADHTDTAAIGRVLKEEGIVFRPTPAPGDDLDQAMTAVAEAGLDEFDDVRVADLWVTREVGPFAVTPVPAVDGFGDPQVSWVVEAGGQRIFHGGDTTFHGGFWPIASRFKPFDAVFLPINGAVCNFPHRQPPSPDPAVMDPEQAALTAAILGAELVVPIHYGEIDVPGLYDATPDPVERFEKSAAEWEIKSKILEPGEALEWAAVG